MAVCQFRPFCDSLHLDGIHLNLPFRDDQAQVLNSGPFEFTFLQLKVKLVFLEPLQHQFGTLTVFHEGLGEEEDVVDIDTHGVVHDEILEDVVHHGLEGHRAVGETEEHDEGFEQAAVGTECGFPLVTLFYSKVIVPPPYIQFGEVPGTVELIDQFGDERKWVLVLDSHLIQLSIILYQAECPSFFLMKKMGEAIRDFEGRI